MAITVHAFRTHQAAREEFLRAPIAEGWRKNFSRRTLENGDERVMYATVPDMMHAHDFAGYRIAKVFWHFSPPQDVKYYLESRIRTSL